MNKAHLPWLLAGITFVFHAIGNPHYGFFRDELYFIMCGRHPAWGYVDQPPLTPLLAAGTQVFGHSLFLLRLIPAICATATVYIACLFVTELGGGTFAQILTAICVTLAPVLASFGMKQSTDMLQMPLWPLAALFALRAIDRAQPKWWLSAGVALGIAFNGKYSVLFFAIALIAGILISPMRSTLFNKWFAGGAAIAILLALPNTLWQILHGLPMWELLQNGAHGKNVVLSPTEYVLQEVLITNPVLSLIWVGGLVWAMIAPARRWIAYSYFVLLIIMIATHAKHYYPASVYPMLFAAGAVAIESWTVRFTWPRIPIAIAAAAFGVLMIPLVMPVLPVPTFLAYQAALHMTPSSSEHTRLGALPQDYADMIGWESMTQAVAGVYKALPPQDRRRTAIFASNYGEAAALDFFGAAYGLPPASSGHNQYFLWGPRGYAAPDEVLITINVSGKDVRSSFNRVDLATTFPNDSLARPAEQDDPIYVSRNIKRPIDQIWPSTKLYI